MADPIKFISQEITLTTSPNTVNNAKLVRVVNTSDSPNDVVLTLRDAANTILATFTLGHETTGFAAEHVVKEPTDTLQVSTANATVVTKAVSIAYR